MRALIEQPHLHIGLSSSSRTPTSILLIGPFLLYKYWIGLKQWFLNHRTRAALEALDDRTLQDIGLTRMDIQYVFRKERRTWTR